MMPAGDALLHTVTGAEHMPTHRPAADMYFQFRLMLTAGCAQTPSWVLSVSRILASCSQTATQSGRASHQMSLSEKRCSSNSLLTDHGTL